MTTVLHERLGSEFPHGEFLPLKEALERDIGEPFDEEATFPLDACASIPLNPRDALKLLIASLAVNLAVLASLGPISSSASARPTTTSCVVQ